MVGNPKTIATIYKSQCARAEKERKREREREREREYFLRNLPLNGMRAR